jgi:hypothetical protein
LSVPDSLTLWTDTGDPSVEVAACAADPAYFIDTYCVIDDSHNLSGDGTGKCRFRLWPAQAGVLWKLMTHKLVIILKARQLGISWVMCAYVLWHGLFHGNQEILLFSKGQPEADELLRRIKDLYFRLPERIRIFLPTPVGDSVRQFKLSNNSRFRSMPATKTAGVSYTASILVIDECARIMQAHSLFSDAKPTIDAGGQMIVLSTANGVGGLFHQLWGKATAGLNGFLSIFLPWWARPERTLEWYDRVKSESPDPARHVENYPSNPIEAFVASGRNRFPAEWIERQMKHARAPLKTHEVDPCFQGLPGLRLYRGPAHPGEKFVISVDPAEGIDDGLGDPDYGVAHVFDAVTLEQAAVLHGRWESDAFTRYLLSLAGSFNDPEILVERNNHGHAILALLKLAKYRRIAEGKDGRPGWHTNDATREPSIDFFAGHLRDSQVIIHDLPTLDEMKSFQVNARGHSRAVEGKHDDLVMGVSILFGWLNHGLILRQRGAATVRPSILGRR